jgi:hypothetical protein
MSVLAIFRWHGDPDELARLSTRSWSIRVPEIVARER